jgi:hypothetical protein
MKSQTLFLSYVFLLAFFCCFFSGDIYGQSNTDTTKQIIIQNEITQKKGIKTPDDLLSGFEKYEKEEKTKHTQIPTLLNEDFKDKRLDSVKLEAWKNYYIYMSKGYKHRSNVFTWQLFSSVMIFCLVTFLVLMGIYFAWLQFKLAMKEKAIDQENRIENLATEINVSSTEIKVSSPVLGVIILIISLLFFYLYLMYVYPIQEIF